MPEPTNPNPNPGNGGQGGGGNPNPQPNNNPAPPSFDPTKLSEADLAKVLENENLWKQPRIAELLNASKELKTLKTKEQQQTEAQLAEQKKFEELAGTYKGKLEQATSTVTTLRQNEALTNLLVKAGVVDLDAALKLADRNKLEMDEATGAVKGVDAVVEALKTDKAYLFTQGNGQQPQVGTPTNNGNGGGNAPGGTQFKFKRSQLRDSTFYNQHRTEILAASQAGLIENDL